MKKNNLNLNSDAGRSLVELMIAMAIGLIILLALSTLFMANSKTYKLTDDKARMEQEGRLALNLIAFHLRMVGSGVLVSTKSEGPDPFDITLKKTVPRVYTNLGGGNSGKGADIQTIQGCTNGFTNTALASSAALLPCKPGIGNDAISIRYVVDAKNANVNAGNLPVDCLGAAVLPIQDADNPGVAPDYYVIENRFYVLTTAGRSELYCRGNGTTPDGANFLNPHQPLVENVEQMRITYGVSTSSGQSVDRQVTADQVGADWDNVISANICLLMSTANRVDSKNQSYRDCTNTLAVSTDGKLRATYSTTVVIRGRASGNL
jgi:type IV pilus assembly protein PilW